MFNHRALVAATRKAIADVSSARVIARYLQIKFKEACPPCRAESIRLQCRRFFPGRGTF